MPAVSPKENWVTVEEQIEYLRHLAAYVFAEKLVFNERIMEIGCGTGYGTEHLSQFASSVIGIDIWKEGIRNSEAKYRKGNLTFLSASGLKLPFKRDSFDVIASFQMIEHIEPGEVVTYLSEVKRTLKKGGLFVVSTPNSKLTLLPFQQPWYSEHKIEYDHKRLKNTLCKVFDDVKVYGLAGSETINRIERNRVRQNPLTVYIVAPLSLMLKKLLPSMVLSRVRKMRIPLGFEKKYHPITDAGFQNKFSVYDFKLYEDRANDCLDLYGICRKV